MTPVDVGSVEGRITPNGVGVNEYGADDEFIKSEFIGERDSVESRATKGKRRRRALEAR